MIPPEFDYLAVSTVGEAVTALLERPDARLLAGGQSLIPLLKTRTIRPAVLIDIGRIADLRGIAFLDGSVAISSLTTHRDIETSEDLRQLLPIMRETATVLADPPVRNRGTFGGSLAFADPGGDWPTVAIALNAQIGAMGHAGRRVISIDDFYVRRAVTNLRRDEVVTHVTIPVPRGNTGMAYVKLRHPSSGYALVGVAAVVQTDGTGICRSCRIGITGAGPKATRAATAERAITGQPLEPNTIAEAASYATEDMTLLSDIYASETYRARLVAVEVERALLTAYSRLAL